MYTLVYIIIITLLLPLIF